MTITCQARGQSSGHAGTHGQPGGAGNPCEAVAGLSLTSAWSRLLGSGWRCPPQRCWTCIGVRGSERAELEDLATQAAEGSQADALSWITSHSFRKTTATILDDAGQSARQIADRLGHARPSLR